MDPRPARQAVPPDGQTSERTLCCAQSTGLHKPSGKSKNVTLCSCLFSSTGRARRRPITWDSMPHPVCILMHLTRQGSLRAMNTP